VILLTGITLGVGREVCNSAPLKVAAEHEVR
jgi:hypothetical protein